MRNRSGVSRKWALPAFYVLLAIPLLALSVFPGTGPVGTRESGGAIRTAGVFTRAMSDGVLEDGRDLFMGIQHFQNGGPPCMGCHNVGDNGLLGGGAMGPDLTDVYTRRSRAELISVLSNQDPTLSPVMVPIYADAPLTDQERDDLLAFLQASIGQPESNKELLVFGIASAGLVGAIAVIGLIYHARLRGVRKPMLSKVAGTK